MIAYWGVIITKGRHYNWRDFETKLLELSTMCHFVVILLDPHNVNLVLIKLPCMDKLYTCQPFYDHLIDKKSSNLIMSPVTEQRNYARSASLQHLNPKSFRINIRKFCPTITECHRWNGIPLSIRNIYEPTRKLFEKALLYYFYFARY